VYLTDHEAGAGASRAVHGSRRPRSTASPVTEQVRSSVCGAIHQALTSLGGVEARRRIGGQSGRTRDYVAVEVVDEPRTI
jgi:hypothetical protein